jgi:predicted nucleotidyltransferase
LDNALNTLINTNILTKQKRLFSLNLLNEQAKQIIKLISSDYSNLKSLPFEVYFSLIDILYFLIKYKNFKVYLFGSYSKLIFHDKSDIDIAIISDSLQEHKKAIDACCKKITKVYLKEIEIHYFSTNFEKQKKILWSKRYSKRSKFNMTKKLLISFLILLFSWNF